MFTGQPASIAWPTPGFRNLLRLCVRKPTVTHRWSGAFGLVPDLMPVVGPHPSRDGVWVAGGYSGHGNVLVLMCGDLDAQAIAREPHPLLERMNPARLVA